MEARPVEKCDRCDSQFLCLQDADAFSGSETLILKAPRKDSTCQVVPCRILRLFAEIGRIIPSVDLSSCYLLFRHSNHLKSRWPHATKKYHPREVVSSVLGLKGECNCWRNQNTSLPLLFGKYRKCKTMQNNAKQCKALNSRQNDQNVDESCIILYNFITYFQNIGRGRRTSIETT